MTGVPASVSSVNTMAQHFRKINQRLASLERSSSSGGGGGGGGPPSDWTPYDDRFVNVPGDRMTGPLQLLVPVEGLQIARSDGSNSPHIGWYDSTFATRYAYALATASDFRLVHATANVAIMPGAVKTFDFAPSVSTGLVPVAIGPLTSGLGGELLGLKSPVGTYAYIGFYQASTRRGWVGAHLTNGDMYLNADTGMAVISSTLSSVEIRAIAAGGVINFRAGASNQMTIDSSIVSIPTNVLQLDMPSDFWSPSTAYIGFPTLGGIASNGSYRIGFYSNGYRNAAAGWTNYNVNGIVGSAALEVDPSGAILFRAQATAPSSNAGPAEQARINASAVLFGKTGYNTWQTVAGFEYWNSSICTMTTDAVTAPLFLVHIGAADAANIHFTRYYRGSTLIGSVAQVATTGVAFNTTSHGPFKGDVRDVTDAEALDLLDALRPVRFRWKFDDNGDLHEDGTPSGDEQHGFIAQELYGVAPYAASLGHGTQAEHDAWLIEHERYTQLATAHEAAVEQAIADGVDPPTPPDLDDPGDDPFCPAQTDDSKLVNDLTAALQALKRIVLAQADDIAQLRAQLAT